MGSKGRIKPIVTTFLSQARRPLAPNNLTHADCGLCLGNSRRAVWSFDTISCGQRLGAARKAGSFEGTLPRPFSVDADRRVKASF
jgi:hypothetical protein